MRVLIVAGRHETVRLDILASSKRWDVTRVGRLEDAVFYSQNVEFQLVFILLDERKPESIATLQALRDSKVKFPIISILRNDTIDSRIQAWRSGALICLPLTSTREEIDLASVAAMRQTATETDGLIPFGCFELDIASSRISVEGNVMPLTRKQYLLTERLVLSRGRTVTRSQIMNHLYDFDSFPTAKVIDVMICKVRAKFEAMGVLGSVIKTVHGLGYCMEEPQLTNH